ncbi:hypothetical protein TL18_00430 [Methanobrevibacter sp. YE315]|uniref:right-handed parallel beta-helix repeat-containing protein n=1 Tax=Methanobrevibacter sp. YE315 TaxID=1609968 RepID=UPI000764EC9F|nr:right-handed parallel beta-helix repeat-containing protein [Methanobrevibacter sp. YE315]AMD16637.1 hypothetical protein TL18_00430 [Methanobrevibacter sp. YE315]
MLRNKLGIIFICLLIMLLSISAINASDVDNQTLVDADDENLAHDIDIEENQNSNQYDQDISGESDLTDGWATFTQLRFAVSVSPNVVLSTNYRYDKAVDGAELGLDGVKLAIPITIDGRNHIIDGAMQSYIFRISSPNVVLKNIVFQNAKSQSGQCPDNMRDGSALYAMNSAVTIINCTFSNNMATRDGGAIFANTGSTLDISNSKFTSNQASQSGGAVYGKKITLDNVVFTSNVASQSGGAVYSSNYLKSTNSKFNENSVISGRGGAVYKESIGDGIFRNNVFERNRASDGGGIYSDNLITLSNSSFSSNSATSKGGAVYTDALHTDATVPNIQTDCNSFTSNSAERGGAIYTKEIRNIDGDGEIVYDGVLRYCYFVNNVARNQGGALYIDCNSGSFTIKQCNFRTNSINEGGLIPSGSAIYVDGDGEISIKYNVFVDNKMDAECPAIYLDSGVTGTISSNWWGANEINFTRNNYIKIGHESAVDNSPIQMRMDDRVHVMGNVGEVIINITSDGLPALFELLKPDISANSELGTLSLPVVTSEFISLDYVQMREGFGKIQVIIDNQAFVKNIVYDRHIQDESNVGRIVKVSIIIGGISFLALMYFINLWNSDNLTDINGIGYNNTGDGSLMAPFTSLQDAINNANESSIIYMAPGTYTGLGNTNLTINKNLIFYDPANEAIIDAEGNSRIFNVDSQKIVIQGITFKNGLADEGGAIKFNNELSDSFINSTFINNGNGLGSAIYFEKPTSNVSIIGEFINNSLNSIYFAQNSKDTSIKDSLFLNSNVNESIGDVYSSGGGVSLKDSWFGGNKTDNVNVNNVDVLSYLFLDSSISPKEYSAGTPLTVDISLYSNDTASGSISKYSKNFNNLTLSLSSNTGSLDKTSVKLGEKFTFTPFNKISSISVSVQNVTTTLYLINDDNDFYEGNNTIDSDSDNLADDSQFVNQIGYSLGNNLLSYDAGIVLDNNTTASNQSNVVNSLNVHSNSFWLIILLLVIICGVLIWNYKDKF